MLEKHESRLIGVTGFDQQGYDGAHHLALRRQTRYIILSYMIGSMKTLMYVLVL